MKTLFKYLTLPLVICGTMIFSSCEKKLTNVAYGTLSEENFYKTAADAKAAVSAMYAGVAGGNGWTGGVGSGVNAVRVQNSETTDEGTCNWSGVNILGAFNYNPDTDMTNNHYYLLMPFISNITVNIEKVNAIAMDENLKKRYIGELKALRAYYSELLYFYYGPVPIRLNAEDVNNSNSVPIPRPSNDEMVGYIEKDIADAVAVLPDKFTGADYGRISKSACYTILMKLYMHEKQWQKAIDAGREVKKIGFSLIPDYNENFTMSAKGGNSEIIFALVCSATSPSSGYSNIWLPHVLPGNYVDSTGIPVTGWNGYRMPWKTYDKFDTKDKRTKELLTKYPIEVTAGKVTKWYDCRANAELGAIPKKFGLDPTKQSSQNSGVDYPIYRYADVELLLAEAINNQNNGPTTEAYDLINDVRKRAGVALYTPGDSKDSFLAKIQNERLFELWFEGTRRDDLIRWGTYVKRAKDDGSSFAEDYKVLYAIPRSVILQSKGVIAQNPGYN